MPSRTEKNIKAILETTQNITPEGIKESKIWVETIIQRDFIKDESLRNAIISMLETGKVTAEQEKIIKANKSSVMILLITLQASSTKSFGGTTMRRVGGTWEQ